jgi:hypothetical protein
MRIEINGRRYKLRETVIIRLQGIALAVLAAVSHKVGIDTAAIFFGMFAVLMLIPDIGKLSRALYWVAVRIVRHGRRRGI